MNGLVTFLQGLKTPATIIAAIVIVSIWKFWTSASEQPPAPTPASVQAQQTERAIQRAMATPAPTPRPTATPLPAGWPKIIVARRWSSVDRVLGEVRYEAWAVPQYENYRQFSDNTASESVSAIQGRFNTPDEIVRFAIKNGIVVSGYTARQGSAIVPQRR